MLVWDDLCNSVYFFLDVFSIYLNNDVITVNYPDILHHYCVHLDKYYYPPINIKSSTIIFVEFKL